MLLIQLRYASAPLRLHCAESTAQEWPAEHFTERTLHTLFLNEIRLIKTELIRELRRVTNKYPVEIEGKVFAFKWNRATFAKANRLSMEEAEKAFPRIEEEARTRRAMVERRIRFLEATRTEGGDQLSYNIREVCDLLYFANGVRVEEVFFEKRV